MPPTFTASAPRLARAQAYLAFNSRTCVISLMCGEQVDWLLTQHYDDKNVQQDRGGTFVVREGQASRAIKYTPLHRDQALHRHLLQNEFLEYEPRLSRDGRSWQAQPDMRSKELLQYIARHLGHFHRTADDFVIRTYRGRLLGLWKPLL